MRSGLWLLCLMAPAFLNGQSALEIVTRSVSHDDTNWFMLRDYTWQERTEERDVDADGKIRSRESKTRDVVMLNGAPYKRLIARDDKPLPAKEEERERRKFDEAIEKSRKDAPKRAAEQEKERAEERRLLQEIPRAYSFALMGEEKVDGRDAWVIRAEPKADYKPPFGRAKLLTKFHGTLWVDKESYHWSRAHVEILEPVSFGLFLFRLNKGTTASVDLKRVNGEIWLPERLWFRGSAKVALVKTLRADIEITYRDYKKFQSSSQILAGVEETVH